MQTSDKVVFISGSARRLGAATACHLHQLGYQIVLHCHHSIDEATTLMNALNDQRKGSVSLVQGDLCEHEQIERIAHAALTAFGRLDGVIHNASSFYPTPMGEITLADWSNLMGSNAMAPLFLSQTLKGELKSRQGTIINMVDIHALRPLSKHTVYCMAKAALVSMTESLALELAPDIRVNAIAPGAIMWPDKEVSEQQKQALLNKVPLQRLGEAADIAKAAAFLLTAPYVTGQVLKVDGGSSLSGSGPF
ncbi:pteridine reductase [Lacimicrobium sp. SS2-24]|uniref:pteridine reductase n=1 Tax=Lacimicrobium sp. SS2-24 TaxID=2005569 RepID=UPI000B4BB73A|nr:pteridine reductase [Lacimicrobium sp. SS2-24]